jgi:endoglucanase
MGMYRYFGGSSPYNATLTDQGIAAKTLSDQLYGRTYDASRTSLMSLPGNVDGGAFRGTDGSYVYVLWAKTQTDLSENASASYSFPSSVIMSGNVTRKDWNFSQTNTSSAISSSNISLNGSPCFFVEGSGGTTSPTPTTSSPTPTPTTSGSSTRIEAENWSNMSGVQTENTSDAGGGKDVGWIDNGDWMEYNVSVASAGSYALNFRVSSIYTGSQFQVKNSSGAVLATVNVPLTGGYQTFQTVSANVNLNAGSQTIRIQSSASLGFNFNWFEVPGGSGTTTSPTPTPTTTTSTSIKTEAENWTSMSGVQTENTSDAGGGKDVGWIDNGDWMDYSISAPSAGAYTVNFRLSSIYSGTQFQVKNSAGTVLATVNVPVTGGFQTWQTATATISLAAGTQTIRIQSISALGWNINWFEVVGSGSTPTTSSPTPTTTTSGTRIEAENWSNMSGVQTENTSDAGGGKDVGWIEKGDWMEYNFSEASAG